MNVVPALYSRWHQKGINRTTKYFAHQMLQEERPPIIQSQSRPVHHESTLFLNRNKKGSTLVIIGRNEVKILNRISYKVVKYDQD